MPATTTLLGLVTPTQGTLSGTWGDTVNYGISDYVDIAVAGTLTLTNDGAVTLANTTGSSSGSSITSTLTGAGTVTAQFAIVRVTGTLTVAKVVTGPSYSKTYTVVNAATGGIVTFKASGQTGVSIAVGESAFVYFNGTDYVKIVGTATAGAAGGSTTQVQYNNAGALAGSANMTFDGTTLTAAGFSGPHNGTVGATTPAAGSFTTVTASGAIKSTVNSTNQLWAAAASGESSAIVRLSPTGASADQRDWGLATYVNANGDFALMVGASAGASPASGTQVITATKAGVVNMPGGLNSTVIGATTPAAGSFTTLTASSTLTVTGAGSIEGLTVGRGAGAVSSNTAVGASALAGNSTGARLTAVGASAGAVNTASDNSFVGYNAGISNTSGINNTSLGSQALYTNISGGNNTAIGYTALLLNTGSNNTAVGGGPFPYATLGNNSSGAANTAIGTSALAQNTTASNNTAVGYQAGYSNTTGSPIDAFGYGALTSNTTGNYNSAFGLQSLRENTTGSSNVAVGSQALLSNTTASNNTAVGYQAGYTGTTANNNSMFGLQAGYQITTGAGNCLIGSAAGNKLTTGSRNTLVGSSDNVNNYGAGYFITTGNNNTVLGCYSGNQGGLDIRTSSGYIVLSDGDGNPRLIIDGSGNLLVGRATQFLDGQYSSDFNGNTKRGATYNNTFGNSGASFLSFGNSGTEIGGVTQSGGSAVLYNVTSDQRLKENIVNAPDFGSVIDSIQVRSFDWKIDSTHQRAGFIAQELVTVAPEAVHQPEDTEKMMAVDYSKLVPMLVKEIQSLRKRLANAGI